MRNHRTAPVRLALLGVAGCCRAWRDAADSRDHQRHGRRQPASERRDGCRGGGWREVHPVLGKPGCAPGLRDGGALPGVHRVPWRDPGVGHVRLAGQPRHVNADSRHSAPESGLRRQRARPQRRCRDHLCDAGGHSRPSPFRPRVCSMGLARTSCSPSSATERINESSAKARRRSCGIGPAGSPLLSSTRSRPAELRLSMNASRGYGGASFGTTPAGPSFWVTRRPWPQLSDGGAPRERYDGYRLDIPSARAFLSAS